MANTEKPPHATLALPQLRAALLNWYRRHKRDLPWRQDHDAYRVWVSEIMLQQTRVAAVVEHYRIFLDAFPTVTALASAPEDQVLALWSGLGYYRRARMLHRAARQVVNELGGAIPQDAVSLRTLPGVGRYTAAAIASIAHGEPVAVVDGNVERVLSRIDGEPRDNTSAWPRAQQLLDQRHPGDWNQAMMELGATVCTPLNPTCLLCPVRDWCRTTVSRVSAPQLPTTRKPQPPPRKRVRMARALILHGGRVYLVRRPNDAAKMAGMWELPAAHCATANRPAAITPKLAKELCVVRHSITDTDYEVRVLSLPLKTLAAKEKKAGRWVERDEVWQLPLTGLTRKILRLQELT